MRRRWAARPAPWLYAGRTREAKVVDAVNSRLRIDLGTHAVRGVRFQSWGRNPAPVVEAAVKRAILLVALLGAPSQAVAQQQPPQTIPINYVNADLADVIRSLATALGVNAVLIDVPTRRITVQTPQPVPVPQVGPLLEAVLESQGLVIVQ